eukprot:TRINITY_DN984_c0_g1_i1.p1 TRINITY_DN984_c0_g1~~TRINITY_DN984_c0_g1_i1.p1  ORF type:complete len:936 (-),score=180.49 TRINITY_DN984_c0_g1_i1:27-2834(-)
MQKEKGAEANGDGHGLNETSSSSTIHNISSTNTTNINTPTKHHRKSDKSASGSTIVMTPKRKSRIAGPHNADNNNNTNNSEFGPSGSLSSPSTIIQQQYKSYKGERNKQGKPHGKGKLTLLNGNVYKGTFKDGLYHGPHGVLQYANGNHYEGPFKKGRKHGRNGLFVWANGERYEGDFFKDRRHGHGILVWKKSGGRYEGEFKMDKRTGRGVLSWPDGERYDGMFKDDKFDRRGIYIMTNGDRYVGDFKNGKRTGYGTLMLANGNRYEGGFKNDRRTGFGVFVWQNGSHYEGYFKNDKRTGRGVFVRANGEKYQGTFKDGKRHGIGISYSVDEKTGNEKIFKENWNCGEQVSKTQIDNEEMMQILENEIDGLFMRTRRQRDLSLQNMSIANLSLIMPKHQLSSSASLGSAGIGMMFGGGGGQPLSPLTMSLSASYAMNAMNDLEDDNILLAPDAPALPSYVVLRILSFLSIQGLGTACQVNKIWKEIAEDESLWYSLCKRRWGLAKVPAGETFCRYYGFWKFQYWLKLCSSTWATVTFEDEEFKNGRGAYSWSNGNRYEGEWRDDHRHGRGRMIYADGDRYEGDWKEGKKHGFGIVTYMNGSKYEGSFANGERDGKGVLTFSNKDRYDGDWRQGKKEGTGTYIWANGSIYEGQYINGKKEGQGCMIYNNGDKYEGEWKAGRRHGDGTETWINGVTYVGQWKDGKRQGQGEVVYANGDRYIGTFMGGEKEGDGKMLYARGDKYQGEWKKGKRDGYGTMNYADGAIYMGMWREDLEVQDDQGAGPVASNSTTTKATLLPTSMGTLPTAASTSTTTANSTTNTNGAVVAPTKMRILGGLGIASKRHIPDPDFDTTKPQTESEDESRSETVIQADHAAAVKKRLYKLRLSHDALKSGKYAEKEGRVGIIRVGQGRRKNPPFIDAPDPVKPKTVISALKM